MRVHIAGEKYSFPSYKHQLASVILSPEEQVAEPDFFFFLGFTETLNNHDCVRPGITYFIKHFCSSYCALGGVLRALEILTHLILTT